MSNDDYQHLTWWEIVQKDFKELQQKELEISLYGTPDNQKKGSFMEIWNSSGEQKLRTLLHITKA